jgi:protein TonB
MSTQEIIHTYKEPLRPATKRVLLATVIFFHVGAGYALTQIEPTRLVVGDTAPMEVSFVNPAPPSPPQPEPPPPEPPPELESMIAPPMPDLPPPVFPVEAPPPKPKPPPPPKPRQQAAPSTPPSDAPPQPAPPVQQSGPRTVTDAQVGYLTRPSPIYPIRSKRAGDQGTVMVKVLVDPTGRPSQVALQKSSGHPELDEAALSALRSARFRPFVDAGAVQAVWVLCPIGFALQ